MADDPNVLPDDQTDNTDDQRVADETPTYPHPPTGDVHEEESEQSPVGLESIGEAVDEEELKGRTAQKGAGSEEQTPLEEMVTTDTEAAREASGETEVPEEEES